MSGEKITAGHGRGPAKGASIPEVRQRGAGRAETAGIGERPRPFSTLVFSSSSRRPLLPLLLLGSLLRAGSSAQETAAPADLRPLPELGPFLDEVRAHLHSDEMLLDQYTFTERHTERELDSRGGIKKVKSEMYEVYPSLEPGHTYRRLVERDGRALDATALAQEDRKHEKKMGDDRPDLQSEEKRAANLAQARRKEEAGVAQVFRIYDIRVVGRETLDGRSAIVLAFRPRADVQATSRASRVLKALAGRAWIDEEDRQLVRVDAELVDNLSFGLGILARLHKGSRASLLRRKVNGEIWLPAQARFTGSARLLLFKGLRLDALSEYTDYRKFTVASSSDYRPETKPE